MARPRACCSPCQNSPSTGKDESAKAAPTESSGTPRATPAVFQAPTPAPVVTSAVAPNPNNKLFK